MPKYEIAEMRRTVMDTPISKQRKISNWLLNDKLKMEK